MITATHHHRHPHPAPTGAGQARAALHQAGQFLHGLTHGHTGSVLFLVAVLYLTYLAITTIAKALRRG